MPSGPAGGKMQRVHERAGTPRSVRGKEIGMQHSIGREDSGRLGGLAPRGAGKAIGRRVLGWVAVATLLATGCAKPKVSDLDAYQVVPMDRVLPYPTDEELEKRVLEVVVVDRPADGLDEASLLASRAQLRMGLEKIVAFYGAAVVARSQPGFEGVRTDRPGISFDGIEPELVTGGDHAVSARFTTHSHRAVYSKPTKMPWQSEADVAEKPGTCTHTAEVAFDVQLVEKTWEDLLQRSYLLTHRAEQENKDLDQACTIAPVTVATLFETAIAEALGCLELPLGTRISPRGHVLAHRKSREGESHIYRVSLGAEQGVDPGEPIEIRRVDRSQNADGREVRTERVIATGVATDLIDAQSSWIAVNPDDVKLQILEGDVVRRHFQKDLIENLTGPSCKNILTER